MYHVIFDPPRNIDLCNECGGDLYQREDDAEDTVEARLEVYAKATAPLLDYYGQRDRLARIDGTGSPATIERRILDALGVD
jgi:adenylate kinase